MEKLNIMLLVGEDTGRHQGCYGDIAADTPAIDTLASEGCVYTNAFSTAPVCAPSRSAFIMGKYAFSVGSHHMRSTLINPPSLFTHELRKAGIYVNWENKTDFNFEPPDDFADDCKPWFDDLKNGNMPDKPWLLFHNFGITHESTMWKENWENVKSQLVESDCCDPQTVTVPAYLPDCDEVRIDIARYHDSLQVQDKLVAEALDALDKSGQRDNTIVIYMSDHGRGLIREKRWCYDAGIHLPLIIRWPGVIEAGTSNDELISWVDVSATILSVMGAQIPDDYQGQVFMGPDKSDEQRAYCFAGRDRMDENFDRVRIVRDKQFLYIRNFFPELPYAQHLGYMEKQDTTKIIREYFAEGKLNSAQSLWMQETRPSEELYDCLADPDNVNNLAENADYQERLLEMRMELHDFLDSVDDKAVHSELELVEMGLVENRIEEYRERLEPLPEKYRIGPEIGILEMPGS
ncbi:MAG: sulfatase [Lentisphaeria bacterium]|nr:sulfatase [Lentisphaeria bacterium]NQZ69508.1 sulfatase [Lentisphaeria bacterium]